MTHQTAGFIMLTIVAVGLVIAMGILIRLLNTKDKTIEALRNTVTLGMQATGQAQDDILTLSRYVTYAEDLLNKNGIDHIDVDTGLFKEYYGNITEKPKLIGISPSKHFYHLQKLADNGSNPTKQLGQIGSYSSPM